VNCLKQNVIHSVGFSQVICVLGETYIKLIELSCSYRQPAFVLSAIFLLIVFALSSI
jgi:hypothetical protein